MRHIKKLFAPLIALVALSLARPALAVGIAQIAGTGTNGAIVSSTFNSGTSFSVNTTHDLPPGSLIVVIAATNATGGSLDFTSCSDPSNGTYNAGQGTTALTSVAVKIFYMYATVDLANGGSITCTLSGGTGFTLTVLGFSGASSTPYDSASTNNTGTSTGTLTVGPTGTLNGPCGSANCEVLIGAIMTKNQNGNVTMDASFTNVGTPLTSSPYMFGYKIVSATTAISYAPSTTSSSGNWAGQLEGFKAAVAASSAKSMIMQSIP